MANKNEELLKRLLVTFQEEARERLQAISMDLLALEKNPIGAKYAETVERIFREAHSLKGAARAVSLTEIESVCQSLESVFASLKNGRIEASAALIDLLQETINGLAVLLPENKTSSLGKVSVDALIRRLNDAQKGKVDGGHETEKEPPKAEATIATMAERVDPAVATTGSSETIRVSITKLDAAIRQAEELLVPKLAAEQRHKELHVAGEVLAAWEKRRADMQPVIRAIERAIADKDKSHAVEMEAAMLRLLEYLDREAHSAKAIENQISGIKRSMELDHRLLGNVVDELLQSMREILMMPLDSLFETFPHMIREIARDQQKQVELVVQGGEIEIDRRVIEELKAPLTHLLRNCIDHGIEKPSQREQKQKPHHGTILLKVEQADSGKAEIILSDDGAGIDIEKLKAVASECGIISAEDASKLSEKEGLALIFRSGVSTSPIVTDLSGRGLGLAIAQERIDRLGGTIDMSSELDRGTEFRIHVPLTVASFRGVLATVGDRFFVVPLLNVERVLRDDGQDVRTVKNRETIQYDGQAVSLVNLGDVLELPSREDKAGTDAGMSIMIVGNGSFRMAFRVDDINGVHEVMVKMLGQQLARVRNVAGACVLGTGEVVPVLNTLDLMKSAVLQAGASMRGHTEKAASEEQRRSILVVEDSITSRALLKNILESAGYRVSTAVDGVDAYTVLKAETFDLIVSDVEMPRMDGFELTAKIRADKYLSELPVVLVTSLAAREHQERGIDVGANAYIVKSNFEQGNLLDVIGRLI